MTTVLLIVIFLFICTSYGVSRTIGIKEDNVYNAKAGGADEEMDGDDISPILIEHSKVIRLPNGYYANTSNFHRLIVNGKCMEPVKIMDKEEWLAEKLNQKKSLDNQIKKGDVVLIHLNDQLANKNYYKIRRVEKINNERDELETYWYDNEGNKVGSSQPHRKELIMGILRYKIA